MRLTQVQIERMVRKVFDELKKGKIATFKVPEDKAFKRAVELIQEEYAAEKAVDQEVNKMLDQLEAQNPNTFERHKMRGLLKKRIAKEKGIIL